MIFDVAMQADRDRAMEAVERFKWNVKDSWKTPSGLGGDTGLHLRTARKGGWSQWVDATLSSDLHIH
jgi:hypothetical protein